MRGKLIILILVPFLLSGCVVSKKKYEAMVQERDLLDRQLSDARQENKGLRKELDQAMSDFETMKYELHRSNALKSDTVIALMGQTEALKKKTADLRNELSRTRRRFESQQATSAEREHELKELRSRVSELITDTASLQHALQMSKERQEKTREELNSLRNRYNELSASHSLTQDELAQTQEKVEMLEKQLVNKEQTLDNISKAFIELRKQMLSARSQQQPLNPNENEYINRIARLLGHY